MLWTDRIFITEQDLLRMDAEVTSVATSEDIMLGGRNGNIRTAIEETALELMKNITVFGGVFGTGDVSANHTAAVMNIGLGNPARLKASLQQVVVSGENQDSFNWIKLWAMHHTLRVFYRGAMNRTTRDRYEDKMRFYSSEISRRIEPTLFGLGLPLVLRPLSAPAAFFERNAGSFGATNLTNETDAAGTLDETVNVAVTYTCNSGNGRYVSPTDKGNSESCSCVAVSKLLESGSVLKVDISTLNPPDGTQPVSQQISCVITPLAATHWNIYVGQENSEDLYLQNDSPIPITTTSYQFTGNPTFSGDLLDPGQYPDRLMSIIKKRQRA